MVLGGGGFVGSAIARRLVRLGAQVSIVDSMVECGGGNPFNLRGLRPQAEFVQSDVRHLPDLGDRLLASDIVFDTMGTTGHVWASKHPQLDLDCNVSSHLAVLQACETVKACPTLVLLSTRSVYGRGTMKAVDESQPTNPIDIQGAHKQLAELHLGFLGHSLGIHATILRLGNCYGPGQRLRGDDVGLIGGFLREILSGRIASVFGGERRKRAFLFVEDAVDAALEAGERSNCERNVFNIAGPEVNLAELAGMIASLAGRGQVQLRPFPADVLRIDPGDFTMDCSAANRFLEWHPRTRLEEGLRSTVDFFSKHGKHYGLDF